MVWGLLALQAIWERRYADAYLWMLVAIVVDATDGPMARYCRVKESTPQIDGALQLTGLPPEQAKAILRGTFPAQDKEAWTKGRSGSCNRRCGKSEATTCTWKTEIWTWKIYGVQRTCTSTKYCNNCTT